MARPKLAFSARVNGDSLQLFEQGVYVGSITVRSLCEYLRDQRDNHTN